MTWDILSRALTLCYNFLETLKNLLKKVLNCWPELKCARLFCLLLCEIEFYCVGGIVAWVWPGKYRIRIAFPYTRFKLLTSTVVEPSKHQNFNFSKVCRFEPYAKNMFIRSIIIFCFLLVCNSVNSMEKLRWSKTTTF